MSPRKPSTALQRLQTTTSLRTLYLSSRWGSWKEGLVLPIAGSTERDLPRNQRFMEDKDLDFSLSLAKVSTELPLPPVRVFQYTFLFS